MIDYKQQLDSLRDGSESFEGAIFPDSQWYFTANDEEPEQIPQTENTELSETIDSLKEFKDKKIEQGQSVLKVNKDKEVLLRPDKVDKHEVIHHVLSEQELKEHFGSRISSLNISSECKVLFLVSVSDKTVDSMESFYSQ